LDPKKLSKLNLPLALEMYRRKHFLLR